MRNKDKAHKQSAEDLVDLIKSIVRAELDNRDSTVLGMIVSNGDIENTYNVYIEPDMDTIIHNVSVITGMPALNPGDYVYIFKIGNQLPNAFIIKKL